MEEWEGTCDKTYHNARTVSKECNGDGGNCDRAAQRNQHFEEVQNTSNLEKEKMEKMRTKPENGRNKIRKSLAIQRVKGDR